MTLHPQSKWSKFIWMGLGAAIAIIATLLINTSNPLKELGSGSKSKFELQKINPEFAQYISAFTTGYISSGSTIKIKLSSQLLEEVPLNVPLEEEYFSFDDNIKGETRWIDAQTLEFKPKNRLESGKVFQATFYLDKLVDVKDELKKFKFTFKIVEQSLQVEFNDLKSYDAYDYNFYKASGVLYTADYSDVEKLEAILSANYDGKNLAIKWNHDEKNTTHQFWIDSIARGSMMSSNLNFKWDANGIGLTQTGERALKVPSESDFALLNVQVIESPEQYVQLAFSNPIDKAQILDGKIQLGKLKDIKFVVENNFIRIYPNETKIGKYKVKLSTSISDGKGKYLPKEFEKEIQFNEVKPLVKFSGSGIILPSSLDSKLSFEAVNLRAVDVEITKIYENNIKQFLQENDLGGAYELARVGKIVYSKTIGLGVTNPADYKKLKKYSLDLGKLLKSEPGAIYSIKLSFKKTHSAYTCDGVANTDNIELETIEESQNRNLFGAYYYESYDDDEEYEWDQRDNPCNSAYYSDYHVSTTRNILASDIGLTVKKSNQDVYFFAASDLLTTAPISGVEIELYDYQQQLIQTSKTNGDGHVFMQSEQTPYFVIAKRGEQRAYIKLEDGASLSLSMFDVGGESVDKGLKGFIYGERGVWRPGDSIFLNFILEDKLKSLPANHPVMFELRNPQGMIYKKMLKSKGMDGFYAFTTLTDVNAPTGNWTAICKVGAVEFRKNIRVEAVMPNRLKIKVTAGDSKILSSDKNETIQLHANWLTGAVARNLRATVAVALSRSKTEFPKYKNYCFDDPTLKFESENLTLFDDKINENGDASFPVKLQTKSNASGMLKASFVTRVMETGGAFSVDRFSMTYSPFKHYVGIALPTTEKNSEILVTGKQHTIKLATVNYKGVAVNSGNIQVKIYKMNWRWWWDQYDDELANYASSDYYKPVYSENLSTRNGTAEFSYEVKDDDWGRYLIKVSDLESGHSTAAVAYFDTPGWREKGGKDNKIIASLLQFSTEKESYKVKDEVVVNIPSPKGGRALITLETGSKILEAHWLETEKGNTSFKFKVTPEMAPNIYVHVSLLQPHNQTANDLPIRLYGVIPVSIDDPETHLRPVLEMPEVLAPETEVEIKVSEENGKEMVYTLAMVDEGLLDLTRFKTPDPWLNFYAREALGVKTWDLYDEVIGAHGGELERILSIGGDGTEINKDAAKANRFKPMVKVLGPFKLGKGDKKVLKVKMPIYIGSVRTMLIAGEQGAYGFAEKTTAVKSPIMILGTLPRVLSIDEEVKLPVAIFGGENDLKNVTVSVETNSLIQIVGPTSQNISVNKNDEKNIHFSLKVKKGTGLGKVNIKAVSGNKSTYYSIELDVRNPNPFRTDVKEYFVKEASVQKLDYSGIGIVGTNSGVLELSTIPPINLEQRSRYLISYPHGCIEQTSSSAFAQLYLGNMIDLSVEKKNEIETNIKAAISSIQKFQLTDGSFSYWPGENRPNDWGSIYAAHFLFAAEKAGYSVPEAMKTNWIKYQQVMANNWTNANGKYMYSDFLQAYRLYVLALAGKPSMGAMNRLIEVSSLSIQAKWRLAAAYALSNNTDVAERIIIKVSSEVSPYRVDYYTYGSSERDEAMILETMCLLGKKTQAFTVLKKVAANLSSNKYLSTQSTAYSLLAVSTFIKKYGDASTMQVVVTVNDKEISLSGNKAINSIPLDFKKQNSGSIKIVNNGKGLLYARIINRGKPPVGTEKEEEENLITEVVYKNDANDLIEPNQLKQGTNFSMEVVVKNPGTMGNVNNLALLNYIPSGWEIHNARMDDPESTKNGGFDYQDIRDDKILTYFDLKANESKTFVFKLNASYSGSFYLPGINVEAMYDNSVFSRKKGNWIKVIK